MAMLSEHQLCPKADFCCFSPTQTCWLVPQQLFLAVYLSAKTCFTFPTPSPLDMPLGY